MQRRRLLQIAGAALLVGTPVRASLPVATWRGRALGAEAQIRISGLSEQDAGPLFNAISQEIDRLERVFSLYRVTSEISQLNATGRLHLPSDDLRAVLDLSWEIHLASDGAFDPTVQTQWRLRASGAAEVPAAPGFEAVRVEAKGIQFTQPDMALTLNGIAQGYIADRIAELMRRQGLRDVVIDTGEIIALGRRPDGAAWRAGVSDPGGALVARTRLSDCALATSSPFATRLGEEGHILDPRTGRTPLHWQTLSVRHESAAIADAVSTAASLMPAPLLNAFISRVSGAELVYAG